MVSLIIYILSFMIIMGIVGSITIFFGRNANEINTSAGSSAEYNKFNLYMVKYTKEGSGYTARADSNVLSFSQGSNQYVFQKNGDMLYFNKIKLCENVDEFRVKIETINEKKFLETYIQINGTVYTTDYVLE